MEEIFPLGLEALHHSGDHSWCVAWSKWHNAKRISFVVGSNKGKFFLIVRVDGNLMVPLTIAQTHHEKGPVGVAKVLNGGVALGNWVFDKGVSPRTVYDRKCTCTKQKP